MVITTKEYRFHKGLVVRVHTMPKISGFAAAEAAVKASLSAYRQNKLPAPLTPSQLVFRRVLGLFWTASFELRSGN
ncbi:hypothetical protein [Nitrospirillum amazonense]|uniref:hypothetical protein n=1 Tax=Nitrospirillum amazonense TaxID=28077 RepID=UPI002412A1F3|nr:hypothetical protein [Nitrospirillum amazonense]MDG3444674.1 hypothetical protein [Nitrospirillum amazonense]